MAGALTAMLGASGGRLLTVGTLVGATTFYGYSVNDGVGSFTPTEFLGGVIATLGWSTNNVLLLSVSYSGGSLPNSGWETININGTVFNRTSASYNNAGSWSFGSVSTNPFGTTNGVVLPVNIA